MSTKERILSKALELFNVYGVKEITLRRLAQELGISQGNLNYHFKKKHEIVSALYFQLVEKLNEEMISITIHQPQLDFLYHSTYASMRTMFAYRFLMKDLYRILENDPALKKHFIKLQELRDLQFGQLFENMVEDSLLRNEEFENEYRRLHLRLNIYGDNWINAADFFHSSDSEEIVRYYHHLLLEILYPYLTKTGKDQLLKLLNHS